MHLRTGTLIIALVHVIVYAIAFSRCVKVASTIFDHPTPAPSDLHSSHIPEAKPILTSENLSIMDETILVPETDTVANETANGTGAILEASSYQGGFRDTVPSLSSATLLLVSVIATVCLLWAFLKTRAMFVVPEIVLIIANAVTFFLMIIFCIIALSVDSHELNLFIQRQLRNDQSLRDLPETTRFLAKLTAGLGVFIFVAATGVQLWFLRVVKRCFCYLKDKKGFLEEHPAGVRYFAIDEADADGDDTSAVAIMESRRTGQGGQGGRTLS